ncbi:uncharacterized protein FOMMEDRAFT_30897 [Fomitiporia mediterranea MF3/22]|uniref:uncharacterized protein n=1 Tax=Fomitiporia mediterranea (strain MF3/22) TaxID=694068 RepID=UPI0004408079|nr:uncharacterized protein FOMMEDRAFT_30897 [Fomitiporia mediterranea MF3/22]EJD00275.1 hypothetical protein FOMMEDRAFT_30897 [Fomitiporia mediterranea MF3/22]
MNALLEELLCNEFRARYWALISKVTSAVHGHVDINQLTLLGDKLDMFMSRFDENRTVFEEFEQGMLYDNLLRIQTDLRLQYQEAIEYSHHGAPSLVHTVYTGGQGRPRLLIDEGFLRRAYSMASTEATARFLRVGRSVVRNRLLELGIAERQENPFQNESEVTFYTHPVTAITDEELDGLVQDIRSRYENQGVNGYAGYITALRASDNNRGETVLQLFLSAFVYREAMELKIYWLLHEWNNLVGLERELIFGADQCMTYELDDCGVT